MSFHPALIWLEHEATLTVESQGSKYMDLYKPHHSSIVWI